MREASTLSRVLVPALCLAAFATDAAAQPLPSAAEACGQSAGASAVELDDTLNKVARELSYDTPLDEAIRRIGYPAAKSTSLYLKGPEGDAVIRDIVADRYCVGVRDQGFTEIGVYHFHMETWIVLARPITTPTSEDAPVIEIQVLDLVNAARAAPRRCGDRELVAAAPLSLSSELTAAATRHARDMALHASFDHRGSDGSQSSERVTESGYRWRSTGENIAAGQRTPEAVVAAWLESPEHCANLMGGHFSDMGVAFGLAPASVPDIYWTQVFGAPL